jgi:hypothetical protein
LQGRGAGSADGVGATRATTRQDRSSERASLWLRELATWKLELGTWNQRLRSEEQVTYPDQTLKQLLTSTRTRRLIRSLLICSWLTRVPTLYAPWSRELPGGSFHLYFQLLNQKIIDHKVHFFGGRRGSPAHRTQTPTARPSPRGMAVITPLLPCSIRPSSSTFSREPLNKNKKLSDCATTTTHRAPQPLHDNVEALPQAGQRRRRQQRHAR